MTTTTTHERFEDSCYSPELVESINQILDSDGLTAIEMWVLCCAMVRKLYDQVNHPDCEPFDRSNPVHLSLETVPREELLINICNRQIKGWKTLAKMFDYHHTPNHTSN